MLNDLIDKLVSSKKIAMVRRGGALLSNKSCEQANKVYVEVILIKLIVGATM
jgi:hypothetical protein